MSRPAPRRERGFTMVELMVALSIGLLVTLGALSLLSSMKRTASSQTGLSQLQDNQRMAMNLVTDMIQTAGYYPYGSAVTTVFPAVTSGSPLFAAGQFLTGATASGNDSLSVRFATAGNTSTLDQAINCLGNTSATAQTFTNTVSISSGALMCTQAGTTVQLVNGVCSMTVLYGVQSKSGTTNNSIDAYINAAAVTAGAYWGKVLAVKVTMTFANPLGNSLSGTPCTSTTLPAISFTRVITVMNNTGVNI
jgi:type IV pilus assembly protein PilW